jgi:hypothetical protein
VIIAEATLLRDMVPRTRARLNVTVGTWDGTRGMRDHPTQFKPVEAERATFLSSIKGNKNESRYFFLCFFYLYFSTLAPLKFLL